VGERAALLREPATGANVWPSAAPANLVEFLGVLRAEAARVCADRVDRLTLTVPAGYGLPDRRDALTELAETVGFRDVELITETHAAVEEAHAAAPFAQGALVLVCDLGDRWSTTLVQVANGEVVSLGHESSTAGRDLDTMLFDDLRTHGGPRFDARLLAPGEVGARVRHDAVTFLRGLKHALADVPEAAGRPDPGAEEYRLTRDWLDRLAEPGLRWLVASCRSLVARAAAGLGTGAGPGFGAGTGTGLGTGTGYDMGPGTGGHGALGGHGTMAAVAPGSTLADVTAVLLVGGGARMPVAELIIREGLGRPVLLPTEPELAVVRGAVRWAAGAAARRLTADHPRWRVEPLTWAVPGGQGRLVRWSVAEGQPYRKGAVLAQVRTPDERVFDLTAPEDGVLVSQRSRAGDLVGPTVVATGKRPASCLAGDPPGKRQELSATGEWLLTPDRRLLVECAPSAAHVRLWSIPDGVLVGAFQPDFDGGQPDRGRVFVNPKGGLSLVAWDLAGTFSVFDVQTGQRVVAFRDPNTPRNVMVNEGAWRLTAEGEDSGSGGRYRRSVATVWDLATGRRLEKLTDGSQARLAGYADRSAGDSFGDRAVSPDGRLHAVAVRTPTGSTALALQASASEHEVFRAEHPPSLRVRMAFSADGRFLLANWESDRASQVDVWEL
jgi:hypothetical protein